MDYLKVHEIDPSGANDGDVPTYDAATDRLVYKASGAVPAFDTTLPPAADYPDQMVVLTHPATTASDPMLGADGLHPSLAGHDHLADAYVAALASAGKTPAAGTPVYAYGDSWTASTSGYVTESQKAINQFVTRLGLGALANRAVGGDMIEDNGARAVGLDPFTAGTNGLAVVASVGLNDLQHADTQQKRDAVTVAMRALFAVLCAAERIEQTAFTFAGSWSLRSPTSASGGSNYGTYADGDTATYTVTTPGTYYLLTHGRDRATEIGGVLTIAQGATTLATIDLDQRHVDTVNVQKAGYGPAAVRLDNVQAGPLTVTFSKAGRSGTVVGYVDALVRLSSTPPTILAVKPVPVLAASWQNQELLAFIRALYDSIAAEFGANVVVCDPLPGWAPNGRTATSEGPPELWFSDGATWTQPEAATTGGPSLAAEDVRDLIAAALVAGPNVTIIYDDAADTITIAATAATGPPSGTALVPLTTSVGGVPQLMWDAQDNLLLTEIAR